MRRLKIEWRCVGGGTSAADAGIFLFRDAEGRGVEDEREDDEHDARGEERIVMFAVEGGFGHFRSDGSGNGAHRVEERSGDDGCAACDHEHDHGFAYGARHAEHDGRADAGTCGGKNDAGQGFPLGCAEGEGSFAQFAGHGIDGVFSDGTDDGHAS